MVRAKLKAGVVVAVATEVVNNGESVPALKLVTVPLPAPVPTSVQPDADPLQNHMLPAEAPVPT